METTDFWKKAVCIVQGSSEEEAQKQSQVELKSNVNNVCPRCRHQMTLVTLANSKRQALFCIRDNVTVPLPIE